MPGLAGAEFFDLFNDPREVQPKMLPLFTTKRMFARMKIRHERWQEHYPNKGQNRDYPFTGIENARPETRAIAERVVSSRPRSSSSLTAAVRIASRRALFCSGRRARDQLESLESRSGSAGPTARREVCAIVSDLDEAPIGKSIACLLTSDHWLLNSRPPVTN